MTYILVITKTSIVLTYNHLDCSMIEDSNQTKRPKFAGFKEKALENTEVRKEYEALSNTYQLRKILFALKKK